jgi:FKBP-type peptidyl-prolyl cis-trans isomerase
MRTQRIAVSLLVLAFLFAGACGEEGSGDGGTDAAAEPSAATGCAAPDSIEIEGGLCYVEHEAGDGDEAARGDVVEVHYTGTLEDGTEFDSSEGGAPIKFTLGIGEVIEGWDKGLAGMKVGGSRTLTIPPEYGYGEAGSPPVIPPNATLIFDVELVSVESAKSGKK